MATVTAPARKRRSRYRGIDQLSATDRVVVTLMIVLPTLLVVGLVWFPAIASVLLSFTNWDGIGGLGSAKIIGLKNYSDVVSIYPPFWPAVQHNLIWFAVNGLIVTPLGIFLAVLLDREMRGGRIYQTALYMPVVLSLALVGFVWQLIYSKDQGLINAVTGSTIDWYGDPKYNLWAALLASSWRQTGYIMLLYLAGLKGV
ncbi:MAG: sugar ABC transporter permease, partial [Actinomycetota bacterium]|nr:sugar ABC transporter permease [Actinomycetota bacterium]